MKYTELPQTTTTFFVYGFRGKDEFFSTKVVGHLPLAVEVKWRTNSGWNVKHRPLCIDLRVVE